VISPNSLKVNEDRMRVQLRQEPSRPLSGDSRWRLHRPATSRHSRREIHTSESRESKDDNKSRRC
jgi:hypothetical protein